MKPTEDTADLHSQVTYLQAELNLLRNRYDTLLEAYTRAGKHYKANFKKWRGFKEWLAEQFETEEKGIAFIKSGKMAALVKESTLGKRKHLDDDDSDLERAKEGDEAEIRPCRLQEAFLDLKAEPLPPSPEAVTSRNQRRKSYHGESSHKLLSPSPTSHMHPFLIQQLTDHDNMSPVSHNKRPCELESSRVVPSTEPRKRRGRYAQATPDIGTINARFSIRKDRNNGVGFQYDDVVRNRKERKHMLGGDCECCREYYEAIGPLPASRQPLWRTPTKYKRPHTPRMSDDDKENGHEIEERKQLISRHRHHWHRPKTPPGYWDIGFPDTQEVLDINRRAAEMHKRKLIEVESEARTSNGRYVERALESP